MAPETPGLGGASSPSPAAQQAFDQALDAHDRGLLEKAEALYRQAVTADPKMTVAHNNLGMVLIDLSRFEEAATCLHRALDLNPEYAEACNNLGFACRKLGRDAEAAAAYERFLELAPDVDDAPKIRTWIAKVRATAASSTPATPPPSAAAQAAASDSAAAPGPAYADPPHSIERTIIDLSKTIPDLPPMGQDLPGFPAAGEPAVLAQEPTASAPSARSLPDSTVDLRNQADSEAAAFFGGAAGSEGDQDAPAVPAAEIPPEVQGLYTEALTKFQDGELDAAAKLCQNILEKCPGHFHTLILMGRSILGSRDFTRATTIFQKAAEARPNDPEAFYFLGQSYEKRGLIEEAQDAYKRCLQAAPDGPRAKRLAKWLERDQGPTKVAGGAARCEFCLRAVPEQDLVLHDNRRCCPQCRDTLGSKPSDAKPHLPSDGRRAELGAITAKKSGRGLKIAVAAVLLLAVALAGAWAAGLHTHPAVLRLLGMQPPPPPVPPGPSLPLPPPVPTKISPADISFTPIDEIAVWPLDAVELTVAPQITWPGGKGEMPANAEPVRLELVEKPEGAILNGATGKIAWVPGATSPVDVPSTQKLRVRASAGSKIAELGIIIKVSFPVGRLRELDMRLTDAYRASSLGLAMADLDGDDKPDLAAACGTPNKGLLTLALSSSGGEPAVQPRSLELPLAGAPIGLSAADVDGDGRADLGWLDWATGHAGLLRGATGAVALRAGQACQAAPFSDSLLLADLDGDGRSEYIIANRREGKLTVSRADGQLLASIALPELSVPVVLAGIQPPEGKGTWLAAIFSGGAKPGTALIYEFAGSEASKRSLELKQSIELPPGLVTAACSADFDGNGRREVALLYAGLHGGLALLASGANKKIEARPAGQAGELPLGMAAGDINGDGRADLLISRPGAMRALLSNGQGGFLPVAEVQAAGLVGPVALWTGRGAAGTTAAGLNLKGRVWLTDFPTRSAPPKLPTGGK